jgi:short-subunit dehydrogenase
VVRGYTLLCVERDEALAEKAALAAGPGAIPVACDLADRDAVSALCARIEGEWADALSVVYLNAGTVIPGDVVNISAAQSRLHIDLMLVSVIELAASAARIMKARGRGHILATVSMGGIISLPGSAAYSAAKAGLRAYLAALSAELRGTGVAVSGIYPSAVDTPLLLHEATHDGSLLNFFGKVSTVEEVADVFERALRYRRVEHYQPYSDSVLTRFFSSFPWLVPPLLSPVEALGRRGRAKYLARKGITLG